MAGTAQAGAATSGFWRPGMPRTLLTVEVSQSERRIVIVCEGEIDLSTVPRLREQIAWSMTTDLGVLRVDASKVDFCDSAGVDLLRGASGQCGKLGALLEIIPSEKVARTLEVCGLPADADRPAQLVAELSAALAEIEAAKLDAKPSAPS